AAIGAALRRLIEDPSRRESLGIAGHARAQQFTWAASAVAHLDSYKRAADTASAAAAEDGQRAADAAASRDK
ncbi:MAG TPA: hypothetical protein VF060_12605, partial [Trebonia sp.]